VGGKGELGHSRNWQVGTGEGIAADVYQVLGKLYQ
jgi:hypothetical protein